MTARIFFEQAPKQIPEANCGRILVKACGETAERTPAQIA